MKRPVEHVDLNLYAALFNDIAAWDEGLRQSLSYDLRRIESTVTSRGISFVMIDMPEAGRILDSALSRGRIASENLPPTFGKMVHSGSRLLLRGLFEQIFDSTGSMHTDVDPTSVYFLRQVLYLAKKVKEECSDAAVLHEVEEFQKVDVRLRSPSLGWDFDTFGVEGAKHLSFLDSYRRQPDLVSNRDECPRPLLAVLDRVSQILSSGFGELDWRDIVPRHGPGAVADARTGTDKYLFPNWPKKLEGTFPFCYFGQSREDLHLDVNIDVSPHEPPSRLIAVPKTLKGPRMIASEPISHQYLQLGIMQWMRKNLPNPLRSCIDFLDQTPSRELCLRASRDGSIATVDLSAASDRLSCWVVERAFKSNSSLLRALHACRTRWLVNSTGLGERYFLKLKKFAPMGSGVTFPVQTVIYAYASIAAILYEEGGKINLRSISRAAGKVRVFGDDILLPSSAVYSLAHLLTHLELKVNVSKSHWIGRFRESCGMDAFCGYDVTPLYIRDFEPGTTAESLVSWVDVSNNAYSKGLWHLCEYLTLKLPKATRKLLPVSPRSLSCLTLLSYSTSQFARTRVNHDLQCKEVLGICVEYKVERGQRETHQNLLQYFVEAPKPESFWTAGFVMRVRLRLRKQWVLLC